MKCDVVINKPNYTKLFNTKIGDIVIINNACFIVTSPTPSSDEVIWCTDIRTGEEIEFSPGYDVQIPKSAKLEIVL